MPELPEVETVRLGLQAHTAERQITSVVVVGKRSVRRQSSEGFVTELTGRRMLGWRRRGKYLLGDLDDGAVLVAHLRMSGQLRYEIDAGSPLAPHSHVVMGLDNRAELRFVDPRTFGELFVAHEIDARGVPSELSGLGIDPLLDKFTPKVLSAVLARRRTALKGLLLDQAVVCGIGNIYGDEICFAANVRPDRRTESLSDAEIARLARAVRKILNDAVALGGSTLKDARYRDLLGGAGLFQRNHAVYARTGEPCPRCASPVQRTVIVGRSAHYCPNCQR